jgi:phasin family protein
MNENFFASMKFSLQPMMDAAEINRKTFEKLTTLQSECMTYCLNGSLEQFKTLAENQDPQAATELQMQFLKDMEAKLRNTAEQEVEAFNEAQKAVTGVMQDGYSRSLSAFEEKSSAKKAPAKNAPAK